VEEKKGFWGVKECGWKGWG